MTRSWPVLLAAALLILVVIAVALRFRAVDTRPLPGLRPTLDIERPTQPTRVLAATATPPRP